MKSHVDVIWWGSSDSRSSTWVLKGTNSIHLPSKFFPLISEILSLFKMDVVHNKAAALLVRHYKTIFWVWKIDLDVKCVPGFEGQDSELLI